MKITLDLDGVLRDLNTYLSSLGVPYPINWNWTHEGKDIFQIIKEDDYKALINSPETEYCPIVRTYIDNIEIWTSQPYSWRDKTTHWINKHLGTCKIRFLTTEEKEARLNFLSDVVLVEDSPNFISYSKIALIDKPYNKHIHAEHRIKTVEGLKKLCLLKGSEQHLCETP